MTKIRTSLEDGKKHFQFFFMLEILYSPEGPRTQITFYKNS